MERPETFYINDCGGGFGELGYLLKCSKCGRKILVDCIINGTNHNMSVSATCGECVVLSSEWKEKNPEQAQQIEKFCQ